MIIARGSSRKQEIEKRYLKKSKGTAGGYLKRACLELRRDECVCGWEHPGGRGGGWGEGYRSPLGACAAAAGAGGVGPRDYTQCHPRSPQLAARRATA
ncbi:jg14409 [Pararge aegeria aegeria]|uniref:Jg14409 protein n=1 Tax=Pararge aegeria aegeria TaxID=348720 RepID=A0A8S4S0C1_9NEOP|nr:jg14409 [Pararge aegeria aegeria]